MKKLSDKLTSLLNAVEEKDTLSMSKEKDLPRSRWRKEQHALLKKLDAEPSEADFRRFRRLYQLAAAVCALLLIAVLLTTVSCLPRFGEDDEAKKEVADYYIENAAEETGVVNIVAGMILDYRAFDTLGESFVLFTALNCVMILLRRDQDEYSLNSFYSLAEDNILRSVARFLIPVVMLFGFYIMLNGHLSPGGGFSGGAVAGAGLILMTVAFGEEATSRLVTEKLFKIVAGVALSFYCLAKSYVFYCGANELPNVIPLGKLGSIFSSGLILPLNVAVGVVVSFTMYGIYRMFRKGSLK